MPIQQQRISRGRQFRRSILPLPSGSRTARQKNQTTKRAIPVKTRNLRHSTGKHPVPRAEANKRPTPDYAHQALLRHLHCHMLYQIRWPADILCMRHVLTDPTRATKTLSIEVCSDDGEIAGLRPKLATAIHHSHTVSRMKCIEIVCGKPPCLGRMWKPPCVDDENCKVCWWWKNPFYFVFFLEKSLIRLHITNKLQINKLWWPRSKYNQFSPYKFPGSKLQTRSRSLVSIERICFYGQHQQPGAEHPHRLTSVPQVSQKAIIGIKGFQLLWAESLSQICQGPFKNIYPPNRKDKRSLPVPPFFRDENVRLRGCQISKIEFLNWLETSKTWSPGTISKVASPSSNVPDAKLTFCV